MWAPIQVAGSEWLLFGGGAGTQGNMSEACDREDGTTDREDCAQVTVPRDTRAKKSELVYPPRWIERELASRTWRGVATRWAPRRAEIAVAKAANRFD